MSVKLLEAVLAQKRERTNAERLVLIVLAWRAQDTSHDCWPSVSSITRQTGLNKRTVRDCLAALANYGLVRRIARRTKWGSGWTYEVLVPPPDEGNGAPRAGGVRPPERGVSDPQSRGCQTPRAGGVRPPHKNNRKTIKDNGDDIRAHTRVKSPPPQNEIETAIDNAAKAIGDVRPSRLKWRKFIERFGVEAFNNAVNGVVADMGQGDSIDKPGAYLNARLEAVESGEKKTAPRKKYVATFAQQTEHKIGLEDD